MDQRLGHIPFVKVRIDNILISGVDGKDHINNLERVLEALRDAGLTLRRSKCSFMQPVVTYCGYVISKDGVKPLPENITAVLDAPKPNKISELRAFLGMLNYYHTYLPKLATIT